MNVEKKYKYNIALFGSKSSVEGTVELTEAEAKVVLLATHPMHWGNKVQSGNPEYNPEFWIDVENPMEISEK